MAKAKELGFAKIARPDRFGHRKYMTIAVVKRENWLGAGSGKINKENIAILLNQYKRFLKQIL